MAKIFFIIPAGGIGARMQADRPKQYLQLLDDQTVLEGTLKLFQSLNNINYGALGISKNDAYFPTLKIAKDHILTYHAGETRSDTVFLGLKALAHIAKPDDWIIVHDAARPGLTSEELELFITEVMYEKDSIGGIMAMPAVDTVKQVVHGQIAQTIDRETIYLAQTPQMFRYQYLYQAYEEALTRKLAITDEASAIEALGYKPYIYQGYPHNFKITHPTDLRLMRFLLEERKLCE
ncbi:2-C-methyl-D-erythritol 4-phosphate cytidylyltransferase [Wohlfahrtiimonas larvae]|uniref:2-C-methyl-D-erythritol 4-phosphate cytidylyltransferase n=1 Tax=Wohlfahrtiimonas larvae TaxID=1157986 RepID=A0ABP9MDQ5_9GAMM|nr:2-C-methyl-D-erythritol 4-phosphate cytidylyltransferase [Wohlfahrtiimonas larvae]